MLPTARAGNRQPLQFDRKNNALLAEIQTAAIGDTTTLQQALSEQRLLTQVLSVIKNDTGVVSRLEITLP